MTHTDTNNELNKVSTTTKINIIDTTLYKYRRSTEEANYDDTMLHSNEQGHYEVISMGIAKEGWGSWGF